MKNLFNIFPSVFLFFLFIPATMPAQVIGGNGEGFTIVVGPEDIAPLNELSVVHPIAIRWPGGGDSKLAFPSLDKPGLGMNADSIRNLYFEFRDPKGRIKDDKLEKDLKQSENEKTKKSSLQLLIDISKQVKGLQVDYCLNVMQGTSESNLSAIRTLIDSGVNVISIVAGNETFYSYNYDFERYRKDFEPIMRACEKAYPDIPRFLCIGQEIQKKDHITWNNAVISYIKTTGDFISGVDVHYYLMEEVREANALHPQLVVYKTDSVYPALETAFQKYIALTNADKGLDEIVDYLKTNLPGKLYHCTEFGDKHAEYWSNTIANAGRVFETFCRHRNDFQILLVQNLLANWYWAGRRPAGKLDDNPAGAEKLNRCHWYAIQLANQLPYDAPPLEKENKITAKGEHYFYFNNAGSEETPVSIQFSKCKLSAYELHYVTGKHAYSSAGQTGFMDKKSEKNFEVKGIDVIRSEKIEPVPANSFGYVKVVAE